MQFTHLGHSGLLVSRLCLGTMNFGPETTQDDSFAIMDRAVDLQINFFDTANVYGWWGKEGKGWTERIIGNWFALGGGRREKVVLATKVFGDMDTWPNTGKLSALNIRRACDASLQRLQTDYIDLYQMHHVDRDTSWDEIWEAMGVLRQQGKILYVGTSNFAGWHIAQGMEAAKRRNHLGLVSEQSHYNLNTRGVERELIPACEHYGMGLIPWSPLAGGLLAGAPETGATGRRVGDEAKKAREANIEKLTKWEALCKSMGEKPVDVALAWLLSRPVVTAPIIGPRTVAQLDDSLRALEIMITDEVSAKIDEIFPGPRTAPEDYAW